MNIFIRRGECASVEEELSHRISKTLKDIGSIETDALHVTVDGQNVVITGIVSSYYLRQKVEFSILTLSSVAAFRSEIEVREVKRGSRM